VDGLAPPCHFCFGGRSFLVCIALSGRTAWRTLNSSIFLLRRLALWLRSKRSVGSRPLSLALTEAMGLEVLFPALVFSIYALVLLADGDVLEVDNVLN